MQVPRPSLDLPALMPLQLDGVQWTIITENNYKDIFEKLKEKGYQPILFSLDESGYEKLSINMTKIRGHMAQQKAVIVALKQYYNVPDNPQSLVPEFKTSVLVKDQTDKKETLTGPKQQIDPDKVKSKGLARKLIPFSK
jgi:hypothetical protein